MKAKFIGDPSEAKPEIPDSVEMFGMTFEKGEFADTKDLPEGRREAVEAKLAGHSHFETKGEVTVAKPTVTAKPKAASKAAAKTAPRAEPVPTDPAPAQHTDN
jgi:hypothetical protein